MPKKFDNISRYLLGFDTPSWARFLGFKTTKAKLDTADLSTVTSQADSILLIGENEEQAAHVEIQSSRDADILRRLVMYYGLGSRKLKRPIKSFLVLLRPEADGPHITGVIRHMDTDGSLILEFHYTVIRVWQIPAEELFAGGLGTMPLAFAGKIDRKKLPEMVRRAEARLKWEAKPGATNDFWVAIGLLLGLKYKPGFWIPLLKGVHAMKESTFYQMILEEGQAIGIPIGEKRGEKRGERIGEKRGIAIGEVKGKRATLLRVASKKWGPPNAQTKRAIDAIDSCDRLDDLIERCFLVSTWRELLAK